MMKASSVEQVHLVQSKLLALDFTWQSNSAMNFQAQAILSNAQPQQATASGSGKAAESAAVQISTLTTVQSDNHVDIENTSRVLGPRPSFSKAASPSEASTNVHHEWQHFSKAASISKATAGMPLAKPAAKKMPKSKIAEPAGSPPAKPAGSTMQPVDPSELRMIMPELKNPAMRKPPEPLRPPLTQGVRDAAVHCTFL